LREETGLTVVPGDQSRATLNALSTRNVRLIAVSAGSLNSIGFRNEFALRWHQPRPRRLIALRHAEPALAVGRYVPLPADGSVHAYRRLHGHRELVVALNLGHAEEELPLPADLPALRVVLAAGRTAEGSGCEVMCTYPPTRPWSSSPCRSPRQGPPETHAEPIRGARCR